jgi:hypothetical protein
VCIPVISKCTPPASIGIGKVRKLPESNLGTLAIDESYRVPREQFTKTAWAVERVEQRALLSRLRALGTPLGIYVEHKFFSGVKTGMNEAFVVDHATADQLARHPVCAQLVHRFVGGEDIRSYHVEDADKWMIVIPDGWTRDTAGVSDLD